MTRRHETLPSLFPNEGLRGKPWQLAEGHGQGTALQLPQRSSSPWCRPSYFLNLRHPRSIHRKTQGVCNPSRSARGSDVRRKNNMRHIDTSLPCFKWEKRENDKGDHAIKAKVPNPNRIHHVQLDASPSFHPLEVHVFTYGQTNPASLRGFGFRANRPNVTTTNPSLDKRQVPSEHIFKRSGAAKAPIMPPTRFSADNTIDNESQVKKTPPRPREKERPDSFGMISSYVRGCWQQVYLLFSPRYRNKPHSHTWRRAPLPRPLALWQKNKKHQRFPVLDTAATRPQSQPPSKQQPCKVRSLPHKEVAKLLSRNMWTRYATYPYSYRKHRCLNQNRHGRLRIGDGPALHERIFMSHDSVTALTGLSTLPRILHKRADRLISATLISKALAQSLQKMLQLVVFVLLQIVQNELLLLVTQSTFAISIPESQSTPKAADATKWLPNLG